MSILVNRDTRVLIQGITGNLGRDYARRMLEHGTRVVGGVTPGKGGQQILDLPVFDFAAEAVAATGANASLVVVPGPFVKDSVLEALEAGLKLISVYTEQVPLHDSLLLYHAARARGAILLGPNAAGAVSPGEANLSDLHDRNLVPGRVGIISKSGTLTYEVCDGLHRVGLGESTIVCLGGNKVIGADYADLLPLFEADRGTEAVVLLGEIGGQAELRAAEVIRQLRKPVVAYVAGQAAPPGKRMGHAGAIAGPADTAAVKMAALAAAGANVAPLVTDIPSLLIRRLALCG